jgi:hypothetical protein
MILLLGDSNLRQTFEEYGEQLKSSLDCDIIYEQTSHNETIKAALEKERDPKPTVIYINSILNEISNKVSRGKAIIDVIKNVTLDQNDIVNKVASEISNSASLYLICNPMMRYDPKWYEERLSLVHYYINKHHMDFSPNNVTTVAELDINREHLQSDMVHLNENGRKLFYEKLVADLKVAKEEVKKFIKEGMEWDDLDRLSQKTPKTARKRKRQEAEENDNIVKKKREDGTILGTLKSFMEEIREDRKLAAMKTNQLETDVQNLKESNIEQKQQIEGILAAKEADIIFNATVREDLDMAENEIMRNTVIIKKMKSTETYNGDKTEAARKVQAIAKRLATEILGNDSSIIYTALLYAGKDGLKLSEGKNPPFKIVFKTKTQGIEFREAAVRKSKEESHELHKAYITTQQCLATRIRTIIMWGIADQVKNAAKGIDCWVNQGLNKPTLQVKGEEKFQRSYTYVGAVQRYRDKITDKTKEEALKLAKKFFQGQVEKIFIVLKE